MTLLASPLGYCAISKVMRLEGWPSSRTATGRMHCVMHRAMHLIGSTSFENDALSYTDIDPT